MSIITAATWEDLGYQKLGPGPRLDPSETNLLASVIEQYQCHDIQTAGDERWVRDKARVKGSPRPWFIRRASLISKDTVGDEPSYEFLERAVRAPYANAQQHVTANWDQLVAMTHPSDSEPRWRWLYSLTLASSLASPPDLAKLLRHYVLPAFFDAYPAGRVAFYEANYGFERRYGLLRGMYASSQYDLADIRSSNGTFGTLRQWQTLDTLKQPGTLFSLLGAALYPHVYVVHAGPIGLRVLFILDPPEAYEPPRFPASWMSFPQSHWDFGDQQRDHRDVLAGADSAARKHAAHGRHRLSTRFSASDIVAYVDWFAEAYSKLAFHLSDPCEFVRNGCIDPVTTFEFALTVDRILRKAISCAVSEENAVRKAASQEIADLLETLRVLADKTAAGSTFFKRLHNPVDGLALVQTCLAPIPAPLGRALEGAAKDVYGELLATILDSVWVKSKLTAAGVLVKNKTLTTEVEEPSAEFVANVVRALRNAHHGYLSESDTSNRPSRYLALITGNTPDSMAYLGVLWALSLVAAPEEMLGRKWQALGAWP